MTKQEIKAIAAKLYANNPSVVKLAQPTKEGFQNVQQWLYDAEDSLGKVYGIYRVDFMMLTLEVNSLAKGTGKPVPSTKIKVK